MPKLWTLAMIVVVVGFTLPASAAMMGDQGMGGMMQGNGMMQGKMMERHTGSMMSGGHGPHGRPHEGPLLTHMLAHSRELGLSPEQERKLRDLQTASEKDSIRKDAEIRVAEIDLKGLLEQDGWDLAKIEVQVKQIAALKGDFRLARLKMIGAGRALLTPEQIGKLKQMGPRMHPGAGMEHGKGMGAPDGTATPPHQHQ